jgi:SP family general alpha glucoside:H+ symporter-like MFS transporter
MHSNLMQNHAPKTRKVTSKACDACRRRKTKCNGSQPCAGCLSANLACTFNAPRGQGGNRGPRAIVLNELRTIAQNDVDDAQNASLPPTVTVAATPIEFTQSVFEEFIRIYEDCIYRLVSLLPIHVLRGESTRMQVSPIASQLIFSFCAYIANFGDITEDANWGPAWSLVDPKTYYLDHALLSLDRARVTQLDPRSVYISFFLYGAYAGQGNYRQAWFYLREATTLFMMLKDEDEDWFDTKTRTQLFWILVVSERAHGVRRNRPTTLLVTPSSYPLDACESLGLRYLTSLFRPLSDVFFTVWNGGSTEVCSKEWLLQLERDVRTALPMILEISNEETANVRISQFWLQIKLWELFPRFGYLSTESTDDCLTFRYPILVARDLTILSMKLPIQSLQIHGVGMVHCSHPKFMSPLTMLD